MKAAPPGVYLTWSMPNYDDPQTRSPAGKIVAIALMVMTTLVLGLEVYSRMSVPKGFGLDDFLIFAAYVSSSHPSVLDGSPPFPCLRKF
jgi:hypothetical protein